MYITSLLNFNSSMIRLQVSTISYEYLVYKFQFLNDTITRKLARVGEWIPELFQFLNDTITSLYHLRFHNSAIQFQFLNDTITS